MNSDFSIDFDSNKLQTILLNERLFFFAVWDSIMEGHPMQQTSQKATTQAPILVPSGDYERNPLFDGADDVKVGRPMEDFAAGMDAGSDALFPSGPANVDEPSNQLSSASNVDFHYAPSASAPSNNYLIGPMVVRVRPDGSPVEEDKTRPLPRDDDREAMTIGSGLFPSHRTLADHLQPPKRADTSVYTNYRTVQRTQQH